MLKYCRAGAICAICSLVTACSAEEEPIVDQGGSDHECELDVQVLQPGLDTEVGEGFTVEDVLRHVGENVNSQLVWQSDPAEEVTTNVATTQASLEIAINYDKGEVSKHSPVHCDPFEGVVIDVDAVVNTDDGALMESHKATLSVAVDGEKGIGAAELDMALALPTNGSLEVEVTSPQAELEDQLLLRSTIESEASAGRLEAFYTFEKEEIGGGMIVYIAQWPANDTND